MAKLGDSMAGIAGSFHVPFPVLALASDGNTFLVAGGGGSSCSKEVPNVVQALTYDEETGQLRTIASLDTVKKVGVYLHHSEARDLWLISLGRGCKVLKLDKEANTLTGVCEWETETAGKEPEQNFAKFSPDGTMIVTGGTDGILKLFKVGENPDAVPTLLRNCGEKATEIRDAEFSGDSTLLASCDNGGDVRLWDIDKLEAAEDGAYKPKILTHATNAVPVKGKLFVKFMKFVTGPDGQPCVILCSSGGRGPAVIGLFQTDGTKVCETVVSKTEPLKSVAVDPFCSQLLVGTMSGTKMVYSLPKLTLVKKTKPVHTLPSQAVCFLGDKTAVSVSGDRSIHFLDWRASDFSFSALAVYMIVVLLAAVLIYLFLPLDMLQPKASENHEAAMNAARKVAESVRAELSDGEL